MPKSSNHLALSRQWELLRSLPSRMPGITARELTEDLADTGYVVGKRTVERDLRDLSSIFPIRSNEISTPFGWYWDPGEATAFPGMEVGEALSLAIAEDQVRALIPSEIANALEPRFRQAREKLKSLEGHRFANWKQKVRFLPGGPPLMSPTVLPAILQKIQAALGDNRRLHVLYRSMASRQSMKIELSPLGIILKGRVTYIVARQTDFEDIRLYAAHRFEEAEVIQTTAEKPSDFDLDRYIDSGAMNFEADKKIRLLATVRESLAYYLTEGPLGEDQRLREGKDKNEWKLSVTVRESWELWFWILSQGRNITVEQPKSLAKDLRAELESTLSGYQSDSK